MCELDFKVEAAPKFIKVTIRDHCKNNIETFVEILGDGSDYSPILRCNDTESAAVALNEHMNKVYEECFPFKTIRKNDKYLYKPSKELLKAIKLKAKLHRKFKKALKKVENHTPACNHCNKCNRCISCTNI